MNYLIVSVSLYDFGNIFQILVLHFLTDLRPHFIAFTFGWTNFRHDASRMCITKCNHFSMSPAGYLPCF